MSKTDLQPFPNCPALDGYHCQTNSFAKIYHHYGHPLSEDMLLGLGAGMDFIYWKQKNAPPFIGGRGNREFTKDLGERTGVKITEKTTSSERKAQKTLLEKLSRKEPVMVYGDMAYLPWFDFPEEYHFGGHTFVICGYDGKESLLGSDMDQNAAGLKKGFYHSITLKQLTKARGSKHQPFPPKNMYYEFDFTEYHDPTPEDIDAAVYQVANSIMNPPISNFGVKGIRKTVKEIQKWPKMYDEEMLKLALFNVYIFIEIGGTGGGCFRYMYSRFLKEAAEITGRTEYLAASEKVMESGRKFTEMAMLFKDVLEDDESLENIPRAAEILEEIADIEEDVFSSLLDTLKPKS